MASKLTPVGTEFQVNSNISPSPTVGTQFAQKLPVIATLTDGRFAVVYQSHFNTGDEDIQYAFVNPDGTASPASFVYGPSAAQTEPATAGRLDGGFGVVWRDELTAAGGADANPQNINFRTVSSTGVWGSVLAIGNGIGDMDNPSIATLLDGRQVVVFDQSFGGATENIYLNIVNAAGTTTAFAANVPLPVDTTAPFQAHPSVATQGTNALIAYEDATGGSNPFDVNITARLFDGASNTIGPVIPIANHAASLSQPDVTAIGGGRYLIVYVDQPHVYGEIYNPATGILSPEFTVDNSSSSLVLSFVHAAATADGGFIVTWTEENGPAPDTDAGSVHERRFDPYGNPFGDDFVVNTTTINAQQISDVAVNGSNVLTAWADFQPNALDNSPPGIRAQAAIAPVFDFDSAQYGEFITNPVGDRRADILFQNVDPATTAAIWQTDSTGALSDISSLGVLPAGFRIDGTGNFNSSPQDDILLRSSTSVAMWPMLGTTHFALTVLGGTSPQWLNSGIGDFTGDAQDDLLFRNPGTNEIATWGIANNALSTAPKVLGSTAPQYHIVAVDDFTGDGQADILFRHDNATSRSGESPIMVSPAFLPSSARLRRPIMWWETAISTATAVMTSCSATIMAISRFGC
jgi:hypothetical protein